VSLLKSTSVVGYIAIQDLTKMSDIIRSRTYEAFFPLIATALIYFALAWIITMAVRLLIKRVDPRSGKGAKASRGTSSGDAVDTGDARAGDASVTTEAVDAPGTQDASGASGTSGATRSSDVVGAPSTQDASTISGTSGASDVKDTPDLSTSPASPELAALSDLSASPGLSDAQDATRVPGANNETEA
jgi:hypothetical protein